MAQYEAAAIGGSREALDVINELTQVYGDYMRTRDVFPLDAGHENNIVGIGITETQTVTIEGLDKEEVSSTGELVGRFACRAIIVVPEQIHNFTRERMTVGGRMAENSALWLAAGLSYESPDTATTVTGTVSHSVKRTFFKHDGKDLDAYYRALAHPDEQIPAIRPYIRGTYQANLPKPFRFETDDEVGQDLAARRARRQEVERGIVRAFQQKYPHMELLGELSGADDENEISPTELPLLADWLRRQVPESARIREEEFLAEEAEKQRLATASR